MAGRKHWGFVLWVTSLVLAGCAGRATTDTLPSGADLPSSIKIPSSTTLAVYLPSNYRNSRILVSNSWVLPGKALEDGVSAVAQHFFAQSYLAGPAGTQQYGLLLALHPMWKLEGRDLHLTMRYSVFAKDATPLLQGSQTYETPLNDATSSLSFYNAALRTAQLVMVDVLARLDPTAAKYPATLRMVDTDPKRYVSRDKPILTGTGFFINAAGQVMTAAHVLHDCALIEVKRDEKIFATRLIASSSLLDLAVMDTGDTKAIPLPLRRNQEISLGEPVANVGFPLQSLLGTSPSLTRGNISSRGGISGSIGEFQFSAPIQPGSSGGPVVSDGGELLGITLATLNATPLIEKGILPQNVNFALDARYAAKFLKRNKVAFLEVDPPAKIDASNGNQAALSSVVSVACYQ